ncbi:MULTISPECIES: helix-turn-helix transcriptional regulator [unclassified Streptomyces]|uniref:helix-turn-helix domain-containing protein n=1 Tax=unclassified Streptomyces TaxID=2593676 RepID=UPI000CD5C73B|nr:MULTISPECIES: helix-turn-helix transcriptional regulator [unclassified Streptomyces]AWL39094.1 XRE family transcriptional regulator [Streptomyces sp. SM18]
MKLVGKLVGLFRVAAGLTQAQLAERATVQMETIASIEQGRRTLLPDLARRLDELLATKGALETAVDNMPEVDLIPAWAERYMDLEREALALSWYDSQVIPGLLQTEAYARAVLRNRVPAFSEDEVNEQAAARLERQDILHRKHPPTISLVVWEAALLLELLPPESRAEQLRHLHSCAQLPGVCLQILRLNSKGHAGLDGPFTLLETPDHQQVAYSETQRGSQLVSDPNEVSILAQKYAMLRAQACSPEETLGLLDRLLGER